MKTGTTDPAGPSPSVLRRGLPILGWLPRYERRWLAADAIAGLSVWALLVPQSLAYASLVGVPVQYGLYSAFAALVVYPLFGTSRHLVEGPSATVGAVSAAVVAPLVGTAAMGTSAAVGYTAALALATGVLYGALGLLRMGWVSTFLSKAVMAGFILGFSIGIIVDQSHKLFGVPAPSGTYAQELWQTIKELPDTSAVTLAVGGGSLVLLLLMRYTQPRWPRALIVIALAIRRRQRVRPRAPRRRADRARPHRPVLDRASRRRLEPDDRARGRGSLGHLVGFSESLASE